VFRQSIYRNWAIIWGILFLAWLPLEDQSAILPAILGLMASWIIAINFPDHLAAYKSLRGAIFGGLFILLAMLLMIFKSGLHAHGFPDFPLDSFLQLARLFPGAVIAGSIVFRLRQLRNADQ
jgi:hypothetical protein